MSSHRSSGRSTCRLDGGRMPYSSWSEWLKPRLRKIHGSKYKSHGYSTHSLTGLLKMRRRESFSLPTYLRNCKRHQASKSGQERPFWNRALFFSCIKRSCNLYRLIQRPAWQNGSWLSSKTKRTQRSSIVWRSTTFAERKTWPSPRRFSTRPCCSGQTSKKPSCLTTAYWLKKESWTRQQLSSPRCKLQIATWPALTISMDFHRCRVATTSRRLMICRTRLVSIILRAKTAVAAIAFVWPFHRSQRSGKSTISCF